MPPSAIPEPLAAIPCYHTMINYKRNINRHIYALWALFTLCIGALIYSIAIGGFLASVLILTILLFLGFIPVTALQIEPDVVKIIRYTVYGYKKGTFEISQASGYNGELFLNQDLDQMPDTDSDHPFSLIVFLIPIFYKKYILWLYSPTGSRIRTIRLKSNEFALLKDAADSYKTLPLTWACRKPTGIKSKSYLR